MKIESVMLVLLGLVLVSFPSACGNDDSGSDADSDTDTDTDSDSDTDTDTDTDSDTDTDTDTDTDVDYDDWGEERVYPSNQTRPWSWDGDMANLLAWTPESDPDADYNRGSIPLQPRVTNSDYWVNANARDEGYVAITTPWYMSENVDSYVSYGADYFSIYTYPFWQYLDVYMIFNNWHQSLSAELFDVAHRNGVKVYNLIMNPPADQLDTFLAGDLKNGFPGADKLIEMAVFYGFDGWFFNMESGGNPTLAAQLRDFFIYLNEQGTPQGISAMMYDSWIENGSVSYQNELNSLNDWYFHYEDQPAAHEYFLNYWYNQADLEGSNAVATSYGRSPYDVFAGFETWMHYWNNNGNLVYPVWDIFPAGEPHLLSLACFQMNGSRDIATSNANYYYQDEQFFSGYNHDPSDTLTGHEWQGVANYYPAKTVITSSPFVTNFNTGHGATFSIDGQVMRDKKWFNRGLQDILPSWRWTVESTGEKLDVAFDWTDAYYGGNCLKIDGALSSDNLVKLYLTQIPVSIDSVFTIAFKNGVTDSPTHMQIALSFDDAPSTWVYIDVGSTTDAGWNTKEFDLEGHQGRTLGAIALLFEGEAADDDYEIKIGRLGVIEGTVDVPSAPSNLVVEDKAEDVTDVASLRLKWDPSSSEIYYYNIYRLNPDKTRTYLGGTTLNAHLVPSCDRVGDEASTTLEVEAVSREFGHSTSATVSFDWGG